jgi:uncharacterized delta-60 repeat protein
VSRRNTLALALGVCLALPTLALGRAGMLDASFGSSGSVTFTQPGTLEPAGLALTADDRPVVVATYRSSQDTITRFLLARFTVGGQLDTSFGSGAGFVITPLGNVDGEPRAIEIDSRGRIVVGGYQFFFGKKVPLVLRYLANGTLDTSFASGGGAVLELDTAGQEVANLAIDGEDRIVAVTSGGNNFVLRLTATGALDESFGSAGATAISAGITNLAFRSVVHDSAGRVVLAGDVFDLRTSAFPQYLALRLTPAGRVDETYGTQGRATYAFSRRAEDRGSFAARFGDGIVLAGFATDAALVRNPAVVSFAATGAPQQGFGSNGAASANINAKDAQPRAIAADALGRIYALCDATDANNQAQQAAVRWTRTGALDTGFANAGIYESGGRSEPSVARGLRLDRFGRPVLLAGRVLGESLTLTRLTVDETADFDGDGLPNVLEAAAGTNPLVRDHQVLGSDVASLRRFAAQQYRDFLAIEGDANGTNFWASRLETGTSRAQLSEQFFRISEARAASIIRMYRGLLGRNPDAEGLKFWLGALGGGLSFSAFTEAVTQSPEFIARTGSLTSEAYVRSLYESFLGRAGDNAGVSFWTAELAAGRITRANLTVFFSESAESIARTRTSVTVAFAYLALLSRPPDEGGDAFWSSRLAAGVPLLNVIESLQGAAEFRRRFVAD